MTTLHRLRLSDQLPEPISHYADAVVADGWIWISGTLPLDPSGAVIGGSDVVAQAETGNVDGRMLAFVGGALHQSKIPASPELAAASTNQLVDRNQDGPLPTDVHAALAGPPRVSPLCSIGHTASCMRPACLV